MANFIKDPFKEHMNAMLGKQAGAALSQPISREFQGGWKGALGAAAPNLIQGAADIGNEHLQRYYSAHGLNKGYGIPEEQANALAYLPQNQQNLFLQNQGKGQQQQQANQLQQAKLMQNEIKNRFDYNKENIKDYIATSKGSREALNTLDRMEELTNTPGELSGSSAASFVNFFQHLPGGIDVDLSGFLTPGSQEFVKLQTEFLRGVSKVFGGRVAVQEMQAFMRGIPNLLQSKEGRQRVIKNLKAYYKGQQVYNDTAQEIIERNGGVPPYDLNIQVEREAGNKLDALAKQMKLPTERSMSAQEVSKMTGYPIATLPVGKKVFNRDTGETIIIQ